MLHAYFDDSGNLGDGAVCVLAGYVSNPGKWAAFSGDWRSELDRLNVPHFKMGDAFHRAWPFNKMTKDDVGDLIQRLVEIINRHALLGLVTIFKNDDYNDIVKGNVPTDMDDPYFFLFRNVVGQLVLEQRRLKVHERTDFYFDNQHKEPSIVKRMYDMCRSTTPPEMRTILGEEANFRDDEKTLPLQASDMLAWQFRRHADACVKAGSEVEPSVTLVSLGNIPMRVKIYTSEELVYVVNTAKQLWPLVQQLTPVQRQAAIDAIWAANPPENN